MPEIHVTNQEITLKPEDLLVTKTDLEGRLTYCNQTYVNYSGFTSEELIGLKLDHFLHPDMPTAVYEYMWQCLRDEHEFFGYIKSLTKSGAHYWTLAHATRRRDAQDKKIGLHSLRRKANPEIIPTIEKLYAEMKNIENNYASAKEAYPESFTVFEKFLDKEEKTYKEFIFNYAL